MQYSLPFVQHNDIPRDDTAASLTYCFIRTKLVHTVKLPKTNNNDISRDCTAAASHISLSEQNYPPL
jgi:hypothetical protein